MWYKGNKNTDDEAAVQGYCIALDEANNEKDDGRDDGNGRELLDEKVDFSGELRVSFFLVDREASDLTEERHVAGADHDALAIA